MPSTDPLLKTRRVASAIGESVSTISSLLTRLRSAHVGVSIATAFAVLTAAYERCRFGTGALTPEEDSRVEAAVVALRGR